MNAGPLVLPAVSCLAGSLLSPLFLYAYIRSSGIAKMIKQQMSDPSLSAPILPLAEEHIDYFLRHKLTTAMPVVAMFIGDKTIGQFKAVFMEELEGLFPIFINAYLDSILEQGRLTKMLWNKLAVKSVLAGAGLGLGIGLLQWMVLSLGHVSL